MKKGIISAILAGIGALSLMGVALATPSLFSTAQSAPDCICDEVDEVSDKTDATIPTTDIDPNAEVDIEVSADVEVEKDDEGAEADITTEVKSSTETNGTETDVSADVEGTVDIQKPEKGDDNGSDEPAGDDHANGGDGQDDGDHHKTAIVKKVKKTVLGLIDCTFEITGDKLELVDTSAPGFDVDVDAKSDNRIDVTLTKTLVQIDLVFELDADGEVNVSITK